MPSGDGSAQGQVTPIQVHVLQNQGHDEPLEDGAAYELASIVEARTASIMWSRSFWRRFGCTGMCRHSA